MATTREKLAGQTVALGTSSDPDFAALNPGYKNLAGS